MRGNRPLLPVVLALVLSLAVAVLPASAAPDSGEPRDAVGWDALAQARLEAGDPDGALAAARRAAALARDWPQPYLTLARIHRAQVPDSGWYRQLVLARKIREALEAAVVREDEGAEAHLALLRYHLRAPALAGGSRRTAQELVQTVAGRDPARGALADGLLAREDGREAAALAHFERAEALAGSDRALRRQIVEPYARILIETAHWPEARALYARSLETDPDFAEAWYGLGLVAAETGEHLAEGAAALRRYLALPALAGHPARERAHYQLGRIYACMAAAEQARDQFRMALALDPDLEEARSALEAL